MAKIIVDGKTYEVDASKNLLHACISQGLDLPYFCWHPAMGSVGACRQCAVKKYQNEDDKKGRLVMSCMEPATDGSIISIDDPEAKEFRANVIEWLMTNHPHDCPICDEGGECHLQDMTYMTGHDYRRYRFKKRTYQNQYLGPFINHEMNRCIQCYRCVRFYRDYAGGKDLDAFASKNHVYFGRHEEGVLENEFSGNLVEVCPTGVFTDKTLKEHYTRKWDLTSTPSICVHCGLGCNTLAGERYGGLRRILSRYNGKVNGYFLCDRGRFGYEFVNSDKRIRQPLYRQEKEGQVRPIDKQKALKYVAEICENKKVIGIGSPRASLESNYALKKFVGKANFYAGMAPKEHDLISLTLEILQKTPARTPSLKETEQADAVFVLGEDLTNTAPRLALALRQAARQKPMKDISKLNIPDWHDAAIRETIQDQKSPFFIASLQKTRLDDVATDTYHSVPDNLARLGFAVAHIISDEAPAVSNLSTEEQELAEKIAAALKSAKKPLIVCGTSCGSKSIIQAAANIANAICKNGKKAELTYTVPESNSMGLMLLGGKNLGGLTTVAQKEDIDTLLILENDIHRRLDEKTANGLFSKTKHVVAFDYLENDTTSDAEVVIPVGTFAEADGTLVNNEGRAQRFYQSFPPEGDVQESWRWIKEIMDASSKDDAQSWNSLSDVVASIEKEVAVFNGIQSIAPPPGFRIAGQKISRQSHRYSGRTAMKANVNVHEQKPPDDPDSPLTFTMEGFFGEPPSPLIPRFWSPGWNSAQSINKYQIEVGGSLHGGDPGKRLIEPESSADMPFYKNIPVAFKTRTNEWQIVPLHYIFGSEEMSVISPAVKERSPASCACLNPEDAKALKVKDGDKVKLTIDGEEFDLLVKIEKTIPSGVAGFSAGLPGIGYCDLPQWGEITGAGK
jgi:NADH-quinone oxidoreductase subunit G